MLRPIKLFTAASILSTLYLWCPPAHAEDAIETAGVAVGVTVGNMWFLPSKAIAMSMGALLLAGGAEGKRMALPNAKILIHQVSGGFSGQAADIEIHAREIIDIRRKLDEIIAKHTKQPLEKVSQDTDRDYFMSAEEAREYNIIDRVISEH